MNYLLLTDSGEAKSYEEVQQIDARGEWESAMAEEMRLLTISTTGMPKILRMRIIRDRSAERLRLSQKAYVEKILEKFGMGEGQAGGFAVREPFQAFEGSTTGEVEDHEFMGQHTIRISR